MTPKIVYARCPGIVSDKKSENYGRPLDGCWIDLQINGVKFYADGSIFCPHCGSRANTDTLPRTPPPPGVVPVSVRLDRLDAESLVLRADDLMCCYNDDCSKRYLPADARGSDAFYADRHWHSGTQFVWAKNDNGTDSWSFSEDKDEDEAALEPRADADGRSWRRCVFCSSLMKLIPSPSRRRMIYRSPAENDQGRQWNGPAATFRISRVPSGLPDIVNVPPSVQVSVDLDKNNPRVGVGKKTPTVLLSGKK